MGLETDPCESPARFQPQIKPAWARFGTTAVPNRAHAAGSANGQRSGGLERLDHVVAPVPYRSA